MVNYVIDTFLYARGINFNDDVMDPNLIRGGHDLAMQFYEEQWSDKFHLKLESFCKKVWNPWFEAGHWTVIDFTQPKSALYQIPAGISEEERFKIKSLLKSLKFPHDLDITRGTITWMADYKFKVKTNRGIWIKTKDYDKYYALNAPFLILIWCDDREARYIHTIRDDPSKYRFVEYGGVGYYDIEEDCVEVKHPDVILENPIPERFYEYIAWLKKLSEYGLKGEQPPPKIIVTDEDIEEAVEEIKTHDLKSILVFRQRARLFPPSKKRGKPPILDVGTAVKIRDLRASGYPYRKIAQELNVSVGMVQRTLKRFKEQDC